MSNPKLIEMKSRAAAKASIETLPGVDLTDGYPNMDAVGELWKAIDLAAKNDTPYNVVINRWVACTLQLKIKGLQRELAQMKEAAQNEQRPTSN